jgi:membrane-associated phospholipid phosphatase
LSVHGGRPTFVNGASIDASWYLDVVRFARDTPWLHTFFSVYTTAGLLLLAALWVYGYLRARSWPPRAMAGVIWTPIAVVVSYVISKAIKGGVDEIRPCNHFPVRPVLACDPRTDYSFPSDHATIAAAAVVGLFLVSRRLGAVAVVVALLEGFSRVYVGAHYPHDVVAGYVIGVLVGVLGLLARGILARGVARCRPGPAGAVLGRGTAETYPGAGGGDP